MLADVSGGKPLLKASLSQPNPRFLGRGSAGLTATAGNISNPSSSVIAGAEVTAEAGELTTQKGNAGTPLGDFTLLATTEVVPRAEVEAIISQIANKPEVFETLARYAAQLIKNELEKLDAKIPNEPETLEGYKNVRTVLEGLQTGFETLAHTVHEATSLTNQTEKAALLRKAVQAAQLMCDGFVEWLNENGNKAGRVIAELGLAGAIAGTLSYFVGVPPMISFPITVAALSGKSLWDAIVLFAPGRKGNDKTPS